MHRGAQTIAAIAWLLTAILFNTIVQVWCDQAPVEYTGSFQLWDLGFYIIPHDMPHWAPDIWVGTVFAIAIIRLTFIPLPDKQSPLTVWLRFAWVWGSMYWLRGFTVGWTRYPRILPEGAMEHLGFGWGLWGMISGSHPTQTDFMFSGHTGTMTLLGLFMVYYTYHHLFSLVYLVLIVFGYWAIISARIHYSADVIAAILIVGLLFGVFHAIVDPSWLEGWRSALTVIMDGPQTIKTPAVLTDATGKTWTINTNASTISNRKKNDGVIQTGKWTSPERISIYNAFVDLVGANSDR